ncbi:MAG: hypothetical protein N3E45_05170 [Oscillatoriaceae bacterium SKW80]|nr:hypothetical protein [Oscillatoriaceae bacterium SKYG93]MCX8120205.1 hypothetical protein [Oscillatoriaceae bacterium SKW80]MDW8453131.1 hypothetical protein [Oscillatoriaceae cyanobacterium SKYGB_i_bin93]HIK28957.1 hypothetical protein [Oscillatoriaceae cyanobacterium M7585_C2015_266]
MDKELETGQNNFKKREPQKNTVYYPLGERVLWQGHLGIVVGLNVKPYDYPVGYDILIDPSANLKNPYVTNASFYEIELAPGSPIPQPTYIDPKSNEQYRSKRTLVGRDIFEESENKQELIKPGDFVKFLENKRMPIVGKEPIFKVVEVYKDSRNRDILKLSHPAWEGQTCDLWAGNFQIVTSGETENIINEKSREYGEEYWGVEVTKDLSKNGVIYVNADLVKVKEGVLMFVQKKGENERVNLALAPGKWIAFYAASLEDGKPIAVSHWEKY